jgi:S1-C subfamily serine protease
MRVKCRAATATVVLSISVLTGPPQFTVAQCTASQPPVTALGTAEKRTDLLNSGQRSITIAKPSSISIRVRLRVEGKCTCSWMVTVRDQKLRPVQTLGPTDFSGQDFLWTNRVDGSRLTIELTGCSADAPLRIAIDRLISVPASIPLKGAVDYSPKTDGVRDWKELYEESALADTHPERIVAGDVVGFLLMNSDDPLAAWTCSGFMLTETLFLTNWHCGAPEENPLTASSTNFWTKETIQNAIVDLSWTRDSVSREYQVLRVEQQDQPLDFAVLRVKPLGKPSPVATGTLANWSPARGDQVYVIHHPLALKKQYSASCRVGIGKPYLFPNWMDSSRSTDFTHDCATDGGSSGSPVFTKDGEIIGLHHLGYEYDPASCKELSENKAVLISEILKKLKPELHHRIVIHNK